MRNTVLSLLVASGLLLGGSAADAQGNGQGNSQGKARNGQCVSIGVKSLGISTQINHGNDSDEICLALAATQIEFMNAGCSFFDDTAAGPILEHGASCNLIATVCDSVAICFGVELEFCEEVRECTIP